METVDADVEALVLEADDAEREILRMLASTAADPEADGAAVGALAKDLETARQLKSWARAKRAGIARLHGEES